MKQRDAFAAFHPICNFIWFGFVLVFAVCLMHPAYLAVSFTAAAVYSIGLRGRKGVRSLLFFTLPLMLLTALVNPAFTHKGITLICYLPTGNPLTLESVIYGVLAAFMVASALRWFECYNEIMTSDKFVYLFGRIIPALSLVLSMALRFVPRFRAQYKRIREARLMLHPESDRKSVIGRIKGGVDVLSAMVTWSLENAIETGDSMRGRGYGLPGRTAYSIYSFHASDACLLAVILVLGGYVFAGMLLGAAQFACYPFIYGAEMTPLNISFIPAYAVLCFLPVIVDLNEAAAFRRAGIVR